MKKIIMRMLLVGVLCTGIHFFARAQPVDGDPAGDPDATPVPLDSDPSSWILVAACVGYGVKKWIDSRHESQRNNSDAVITDLLQEDKTNKNC